MNIKIIVATHKKYHMPEDELYLPLHVGKENTDTILPYPGDNTGTHISSKNPQYCELTALYWAWKNLDADSVGLAHYRRHFSVRKPWFPAGNKFMYILSGKEAQALLSQHDIVLPKPRNYFIETNYSHYIHAHPKESLDLTEKIIKERFPDYSSAYTTVMNRTKAHMFNMFLMKKERLDSYCTWLFEILEQLEHTLDISSYDTYNQRIFGFVSELLLDVYIEKNQLSYKEIDYMFMENEHWIKKGFHFLKRKFIH